VTEKKLSPIDFIADEMDVKIAPWQKRILGEWFDKPLKKLIFKPRFFIIRKQVESKKGKTK